jgi:predicted AlkP superfamily pyrophosphatase or phosphodiesterase
MRRGRARLIVGTILAAFANLGSVGIAASLRQDRHIVIVVWDGMRPDFVSEQNTPTLWNLAKGGVTFRNHHSVYPSATIVNGTAINTGFYPDRSGILANHDYRPEIHAQKSIDVETVGVVRKGDDVSGGKYLTVPTIAELVHEHGGETAIATAKTVGLLFDRHCDSSACRDISAGTALPHDAVDSIVKLIGAFPPANRPGDRDSWTARAVTDFLWEKKLPVFSLLWLSEPDDTEHHTAPGDPVALAAIKSSDQNLARVLEALDKKNARSTTDVFVVSDHGFSTIARSINVPKILRDAGFDAVIEFANEPKPGQIMIVGNGGTVLFYVIGHDASITRRLVEFLQQTDFAGVIFTREAMEGTFTFDKAKVDSAHAPDVEMAFRWNENQNQFGAPGMMDGDWQRAAGKGTHATLGKFDMHNMLIAAGPDFKNGLTSELPSGNVDLAPTICSILGINPSSPMDGRLLEEAMASAKNSPAQATTENLEATKKFLDGEWRQRLRISRVGSTIYLDEGNGAYTR